MLDVGRRVVDAITGVGSGRRPASGIVVADELTPADAAGLDPERVLAIATARGSTTAHAAILARALGLPAVVGLGARRARGRRRDDAAARRRGGHGDGRPAGRRGARCAERRERAERRRAAARERAHEPAVTRDGERIEVFANLGTGSDAARAVELGAEGVGLLRTEFLFLDRDELPDEDEQAQTLREIARALEGRPLIVRTLDAGADKPLPALPMPPEDNPFLGVRGIRLALARPEVLATQFRAILRVAAEYPVKTMLPMVATLAEITAARELLERARATRASMRRWSWGSWSRSRRRRWPRRGWPPTSTSSRSGTNDLTQYTMAAERGDARLAPLLAGPQPAVLRLVAGDRRGRRRARPLGGGVRRAGRRPRRGGPAGRARRHRAEHGRGAGPRGQGGAARGVAGRRPGGGARPRWTPTTPTRRAGWPCSCCEIVSSLWRRVL